MLAVRRRADGYGWDFVSKILSSSVRPSSPPRIVVVELKLRIGTHSLSARCFPGLDHGVDGQPDNDKSTNEQ